MDQLPQVPHVPITYWSIGLFSFLATLVELSNWVTFTYGHTRYEYWGRVESVPQKQSGYSAWTAAGPYLILAVHTGTRLAEEVAVPDGVPVLEKVLLRVVDDVRELVAVTDELFVATGVAVKDRDTEDEGVCDALTEAELDALDVPVVEPEADEDAEDETLIVDAGLPNTDDDRLDAGLPDTDNDSVDTGLPDTDALTVAAGDSLAEGVCVTTTEGTEVGGVPSATGIAAKSSSRARRRIFFATGRQSSNPNGREGHRRIE